jgi:hypothetical protein
MIQKKPAATIKKRSQLMGAKFGSMLKNESMVSKRQSQTMA